MGLFDSILNDAKRKVSQSVDSAVNKAARDAVGTAAERVSSAVSGAGKKKETFVFDSLPRSVGELAAMPEADLSTPFKAAALTVAALCMYETDPQVCFEMLDFLKGPQPLSTYEKQFLRDRLGGKGYKPFSFFEGAVPQNSYTPNKPYKITFTEAYYQGDDNYRMLEVVSGGADSPRQIKLRCKGGQQWLLWEQYLISDIRTPAKDDPWA